MPMRATGDLKARGMDPPKGERTNQRARKKRGRLTIGYGQPPILLLNFELIGEPAAVWVLSVVHLCFIVG